VVIAILAGALTDIRQHKLLVSGVALLVWIIVISWVEGTWWLYLAAGDRWPILNRSTFWLWYGGGTQVIWCAGAAISGWVAARLGGRSSAAMILVSLVTVVPLSLWWGGPWLIRSFETGAWWRIPQRVFALTVLVGMPMGTLIGGLVAGPANRTSS
jgi:hypothetical protein